LRVGPRDSSCPRSGQKYGQGCIQWYKVGGWLKTQPPSWRLRRRSQIWAGRHLGIAAEPSASFSLTAMPRPTDLPSSRLCPTCVYTYRRPPSQHLTVTAHHTSHTSTTLSQWPLNVSPTSSPTSPPARLLSSRCMYALRAPSPQLSPDSTRSHEKRSCLADRLPRTAPPRTPTMLSSHSPSAHL
jgi:hypothetical protein